MLIQQGPMPLHKVAVFKVQGGLTLTLSLLCFLSCLSVGIKRLKLQTAGSLDSEQLDHCDESLVSIFLSFYRNLKDIILLKILITVLLFRAIILAVAVLKAGAENSDIHRKSSKVGTFVVRFSLLIFIETLNK